MVVGAAALLALAGAVVVAVQVDFEQELDFQLLLALLTQSPLVVAVAVV